MSELRAPGEKPDPSFLQFLVQALRQRSLAPEAEQLAQLAQRAQRVPELPPSDKEWDDRNSYVNPYPQRNQGVRSVRS